MNILNYPFDSGEILKRKKNIRRNLLEQQHNLTEKRIAVLSGSTIGDIKDILEIFLLNFGIKPLFYVGQFNRFYEDVMFGNQELSDFRPDLIYFHTSLRNLIDEALLDKLKEVWTKVRSDFSCPVIQNNFELPVYTTDFTCDEVNGLNIEIADFAKKNNDFYVNDIQHLSACFGLDDWFDEQDYFLYKYAFNVKAIPSLCFNIAKIIKSIYGKNKKCLVLDLDNTLWGGEIGDVGFMEIELGEETALGEAYVIFQKYVKFLHSRGVILAVCSKNEENTAKRAFDNPNMVLQLEDITVFYANWNNKADNIVKIAEKLNILTESIVFIDDNPAEREIVRQALPDVSIPEVNSVVEFIRHIENAGYFYATNISDDDKKRNEYYAADVNRNELKNTFADYGDYLSSLQMSSEIRSFDTLHIDRITQLINKTNQFNLTTKRYSKSEVEAVTTDSRFIALYATLVDKFGSNGIVSAFIGEMIEQDLHIRLWVMSCRVFNRELELAVFDRFVEICIEKNIKKIIGYYFKTEKNMYVATLFDDLKFEKIADETYKFDLTTDYQCKNNHIKIEKEAK